MSKFSGRRDAKAAWKRPFNFHFDIAPIMKLLVNFLWGQGALQVLQLLTGFFLIRSMEVPEYAVVVIALSVQIVMQALSDLGCRDGVLAMAGGQRTDPLAMDSYILGALRLRRRFLIVAAGFSAAVYTYLWIHQTIGLEEAISLCFCSVAGAYFNGLFMYYSVPTVMNKDISAYYGIQIIFSVLRTVSFVVIKFVCGELSATPVVIVNTVAGAAIGLGFSLRHVRAQFIPEPRIAGASSELFRYSLKIMPQVIYNAIQDQVVTFLLMTFGKQRAISEVFALGRLGQLLQVLTNLNSVLLGPWFARSSADMVKRKYAKVAAGALMVAIAVMSLVFAFPQSLLWVLGKNYSHLESELKLSMLVSCVFYLSHVMWSVNVARRWIWRWTGIIYVVCVLSTQIVAVGFFDISTPWRAIMMNLIVVVVVFLFQAFHSLAGLHKLTAHIPSKLDEQS